MPRSAGDRAEDCNSAPSTLRLGPRIVFLQLLRRGWCLSLTTKQQSSEARAQYSAWPDLHQRARPLRFADHHLPGASQVAEETAWARGWGTQLRAPGAGPVGIFSMGAWLKV